MSSIRRHSRMVTRVVAGVLALGAAGCATRSYVSRQVEELRRSTEAKLGELRGQAEADRLAAETLRQVDAAQNEQISQLAELSREALTRAIEAGRLVRGRLVREIGESEDGVHFPANGATLSEQDKRAIDRFAAELKGGKEDVYIEVQGHTDDAGPAELNLRLGERRAEVVMHYLHLRSDIPLHRMNVISYGEKRPIADNRTPEGRALNRRVTLIVLT